MKRGDLVTVVSSGDYGKPRPALVMQQADDHATHPSLTILPLTSEVNDLPLFRVTVEPTKGNGLRLRSQVMVDKATTIPRVKVGSTIGRLDAATLATMSRALIAFLGLIPTACCPDRSGQEGQGLCPHA